MVDINLDKPEWTVDYFKRLNEKADELGLPWLKVIIDDEKKMVYKDNIHMLLGIGIQLEG